MEADCADVLPDLSPENLRLMFSLDFDREQVEIQDKRFGTFLNVVRAYSDYIRRFHRSEFVSLLPLAEKVVGEFETNSEGTDVWLSTLLAIQRLYHFSEVELSIRISVLADS